MFRVHSSRLVLLVADVLHPLHCFAIELFLNGDVRHGRRGRSAMPMLLTRRKPDHVAGMDGLDGSSPALREAGAGGDDEGLAQWVRVPCGPGARLERDAGAGDTRRVRGLDERVRCVPCR